MTVHENLELGAYTLRMDGREKKRGIARILEYFPMLERLIGQPAATLSGGEQQISSHRQGSYVPARSS